MKYIMNRDVTVTSTFGHTIHFKKDVPVQVPPALRTLVQERGGIPAEGETVHEDAPKKPAAPQGAERLEILVLAIEDMVAKNERGDFGANSLPTVKALSREVGFDVDSRERDEAWKQYKEKGSA